MASQFPAGNSPAAVSTPAGEQATYKNSGKKRRRDEKERHTAEGKKKGNAVKVEAKKEASPMDRPSRERKAVERYAAVSPRRMSATKALLIQQGTGEKLKDIPNVAFKLSKRKVDECVHVLHAILFGRKANVHFLKRNILQFSGFVWSQNENKDRSKVLKKLNKCHKDMLLEFCDLLDIYTVKASTKKEEILVKLQEFFESPHVTREMILENDKKDKQSRLGAKGNGPIALEEASSEKEKKKDKKSRLDAKGNGGRALEEASSEKEKKSKKRAVKGKGKLGRSKPVETHEEDQVKGDSVSTDDESADEDKNDDAKENSQHSMSEADVEGNENEPEMTNNSSDVKEMNKHDEPETKEKSPSTIKVSRRKGPSTSDSKQSGLEVDTKVTSGSKRGFSKDTKGKLPVKKDLKDNSKVNASQKKGEAGSGSGKSDRSKKVDNKKGKSDVGTSLKDSRVIKKQVATADSKNAGKEGKSKDVSVEPSAAQMHAVLSEILEEVDFNVATIADIIKQLGSHFNTDLMHRKSEIKSILQEVINNMTDDEDDDGDGCEA